MIDNLRFNRLCKIAFLLLKIVIKNFTLNESKCIFFAGKYESEVADIEKKLSKIEYVEGSAEK